MKTVLASLAVFLATIVAAAAPRAEAVTLTVDRPDDVMASSCSDAVANDCSLRGAIARANALPGADTIVVPAGTYTLHAATAFPDDVPGEGGLDSNAALLILEDLTITGAGAGSTIIQSCIVDQKAAPCPPGQGIDKRVFSLSGAVMTVAISDVTIRHGRAEGTGITVRGGNGGAIYNDVPSTLTLRRVVVADNVATIEGGGLFNRGPETLILIDTTVHGNLAGNGGGIANIHGGATQLLRSTVSGNTAANNGGGIHNRTGGLMAITNSTVSGNLAAGDGGGILNAATLDMINTTVAANDAGAECGGGLAVHSQPFLTEIGNSILAGNTCEQVTPSDCSGTFTSLGHVLLGESAGCDAVGGPVITDVDALLGPLADNGGPTRTHALLAGSPAIDTGDNELCPVDDQRGVARPTDGNGNGLAVCDIGAYEASGSVPGGTTVPLERLQRALFNLTKGLKAAEQYTERQARFTVPAGYSIDPFTDPFRLRFSEPGCGGLLSEVVLPPGSFKSLRNGAEAQAALKTRDLVTGVTLSLLVHLVRRPGDEWVVTVRTSDALYHCLRGAGARTITMALTFGDVTAETAAVFERRGNGDLVTP